MDHTHTNTALIKGSPNNEQFHINMTMIFATVDQGRMRCVLRFLRISEALRPEQSERHRFSHIKRLVTVRGIGILELRVQRRNFRAYENLCSKHLQRTTEKVIVKQNAHRSTKKIYLFTKDSVVTEPMSLAWCEVSSDNFGGCFKLMTASTPRNRDKPSNCLARACAARENANALLKLRFWETPFCCWCNSPNRQAQPRGEYPECGQSSGFRLSIITHQCPQQPRWLNTKRWYLWACGRALWGMLHSNFLKHTLREDHVVGVHNLRPRCSVSETRHYENMKTKHSGIHSTYSKSASLPRFAVSDTASCSGQILDTTRHPTL